jgi:methylenetetrahydrofolate dehydrogenase (NADP+) / methenyltetrahydrofolate cyclohydrolase
VTARLLDGRAVARAVREEVAADLAGFRAAGWPAPRLAVVQVGEDPAAASYTRSIVRSFESAGLACTVERLPAGGAMSAVLEAIRRLSDDPAVHGILVQAPLPPPLSLAEAAAAMAPKKDVDGAHPLNAGLLALGRPAVAPCTPVGGLELLQRAEIPIAGRRAVVVGRGPTVGRPLALLLLGLDATVTVCHSRTPDLASFTREADILVAAAGRPGLIRAAMVKPGAAVLDFGVNDVDGQLVGDVAFDEVREIAGAITPVPGGTGPVTNAVLLRQVVQAARGRRTS